jgi:hypothetical protein
MEVYNKKEFLIVVLCVCGFSEGKNWRAFGDIKYFHTNSIRVQLIIYRIYFHLDDSSSRS